MRKRIPQKQKILDFGEFCVYEIRITGIIEISIYKKERFEREPFFFYIRYIKLSAQMIRNKKFNIDFFAISCIIKVC